MHKVLILTTKIDPHAEDVTKCLIKRGALPINWFVDEFLFNQKIIQKIGQEYEQNLIVDNNNIDLLDIDVVWYRRVLRPTLPDSVSSLDKEYVQRENLIYLKSLWLTLGESAKWVNPFSSIDKSNSKVLQLRNAYRLGLSIPETLITNDKSSIINFIQKNEKDGTIFKTFSPTSWQENDQTFGCYTASITADMLSTEENMALTPGIFQKRLRKDFEARVTFFGEEYIAVKIHNTEELDWRVLFSNNNLKLSPLILPTDVEKKCISLMKNLGIVFGCFDFIVTPEGEYVFLEVNEMGQFLWVEEVLPELKMLDKFCDFLLSES